MLNTNFLAANNLTTFYLENLCKKMDFIDVYEKYLIPFSRLTRIAMLMTTLIGIIFLPFQLYHIFIQILGLALYRIIYLSIDTDHDILNPMISHESNGYQINLYRQMLIYCKTENGPDKGTIYNYLQNMEIFQNEKYWQYNCEVIIEMIFDSILDCHNYISEDDFKLYLSNNNIPSVQGLKLNTINVLRYFAIYNKLKGNDKVFDKIVADMRIQVTEIEFGEEPILRWFVNMYWRYVNELENGNVDVLEDFKYDCYYYFDDYLLKRKYVGEMFNHLEK
ncbi:MAG: hypothetical protein ACLUVC_05055 [Longibaculum sp.]